jgi:diadenosine tetraphosphate (Ap4A) HIT family hydrolase
MECYSCKSLSGELRISPGPTIYSGTYWVVEHAFPSKLKGWLVIVLKRHAEALHDLSSEEFVELAELQERTVRLLHAELDSEKEYLMCLAEAEHFKHIHVHVVPKPRGLPEELRGTAIFSLLKVGDSDILPVDAIKHFCNQMRERFAQQVDVSPSAN